MELYWSGVVNRVKIIACTWLISGTTRMYLGSYAFWEFTENYTGHWAFIDRSASWYWNMLVSMALANAWHKANQHVGLSTDITELAVSCLLWACWEVQWHCIRLKRCGGWNHVSHRKHKSGFTLPAWWHHMIKRHLPSAWELKPFFNSMTVFKKETKG